MRRMCFEGLGNRLGTLGHRPRLHRPHKDRCRMCRAGRADRCHKLSPNRARTFRRRRVQPWCRCGIGLGRRRKAQGNFLRQPSADNRSSHCMLPHTLGFAARLDSRQDSSKRFHWPNKRCRHRRNLSGTQQDLQLEHKCCHRTCPSTGNRLGRFQTRTLRSFHCRTQRFRVRNRRGTKRAHPTCTIRRRMCRWAPGFGLAPPRVPAPGLVSVRCRVPERPASVLYRHRGRWGFETPGKHSQCKEDRRNRFGFRSRDHPAGPLGHVPRKHHRHKSGRRNSFGFQNSGRLPGPLNREHSQLRQTARIQQTKNEETSSHFLAVV